ncbi:ACT domain-containing protein [Marinicella sp. W31]|uniref:ACT domain-containing protein n=1 Tax=Marinicella sp. W31 TaxID=3023713 RepID=UPI003757041A
MSGETHLDKLLQNMHPQLMPGKYVFVSVTNYADIKREDTVCEFKEEEGITMILEKHKADQLNLSYTYVSAWITLTVHSSLQAVGLTAAFSEALARHEISCNVIAGYYHDHIFVDVASADRAMQVLRGLSKPTS